MFLVLIFDLQGPDIFLFGVKDLNTTLGDKQAMKTEIDYQWCLTVNQDKPARKESMTRGD